MGDDRVQHIGDDQLIYGLPKHMEGVANTGANEYWEIVPSKNACRTCKLLMGMRSARKPVPVHPNCTCEARRVSPPERQPKVVAFGLLQGYEDIAAENFGAGQKITITFLNLGPFPAGVEMRIDYTTRQSTGFLVPGLSDSFSFYKFGETPLWWNVNLTSHGLEGSTIRYEIRG
ncbi:MAG TPA: hypothetical protein VN419_10955 [Humidesulfovibrio sp.]|uniref:hypothetical protein n=1 Tax=Humidesulfovibrio sp. TaxID=2910988 RepID=UPI002C6FCC86|nr:hypothetical protein [Humidesulfovibrio sp.]HWR04526.1 hypothetical protein [Humidesulfovibrio sp.]